MTRGVENKLIRIERSLNRMVNGGGIPELPIDYCCNYIAWCAKFNLIEKDRVAHLADLAIEAMNVWK